MGKDKIFNLMGRKLGLFEARDQDRVSLADYLERSYIKLLDLLAPDLSLEIGAREASYSRQARPVLPCEVPVLAFEASPATYSYYAKELALLPGLDYLNLAMTDKNGMAEFYEYFIAGQDKASAYSSIHERDEHARHGAVKKLIEVEVVSGDAFLAAQQPDKNRIACWIDVEGGQAEVLAGLKNTFAAGKIVCAYIEVELHKLWPQQKMLAGDIIEFMAEQGLLACLRDNQWLSQFNIIFVHKDALQQHHGKIMDISADYLAYMDHLLQQ